ncbi:MAG: FAD-binding oxidoreductase, partial [Pseudomonadota bacterium]
PIGSYIIATEELPPETVQRLMPNNRAYSDTRKVVYYYRLSPDKRRILFGGRVSINETDPERSAPSLRRDLIGVFPDLDGVRLSHSWMGFVAYTFDTMAHIGQQDGLYYAMGYCGSGVSMASYLGMRVGHKVLGATEGKTALDDVTFQTRPMYYGKPWFLAGSIAWYRWRDRQNV